ncbi:DUF3899 domain-containing protein [Mesobacillus maritimus]|uniref:DUF3899 domain-containing protein n=1 Tax=Mesobacillus maritimus TaxID=1643336 RepID=UPI00203F4EF4|nr:DUF3899 domain-containing protein [Mesobacillus maritimus]MCM3588187.1 DUF3899 domain-containing protein [Mesobacillus maritimus]MCM3668879.1 DUF3899 domain-containing protein [Mesobacillus maritimus]
MFYNKWLFLLLNLLLSFVFFLILADEYTFVHYINTLFYFAFLYLLYFLLQYTKKGGFFDGVTFGFRRFHHTFIKRDDYLEEWKEKPLPSQKVGSKRYEVVRFQSLGLIGLLCILLFVYYLLIER